MPPHRSNGGPRSRRRGRTRDAVPMLVVHGHSCAPLQCGGRGFRRRGGQNVRQHRCGCVGSRSDVRVTCCEEKLGSPPHRSNGGPRSRRRGRTRDAVPVLVVHGHSCAPRQCGGRGFRRRGGQNVRQHRCGCVGSRSDVRGGRRGHWGPHPRRERRAPARAGRRRREVRESRARGAAKESARDGSGRR